MSLTASDLLGSAAVVSLDVFDTCLHRTVLHPVDVFCLVPDLVAPEVAGAIPSEWRTPSVYRTVRRRAERRARVSQPSGEVTLDEIIDALLAPLSLDDEARVTVHQALVTAEIDAELRSLRPNLWARDLAWSAFRSRTMVYVSDMYLPSTVIGRLLESSHFPAGDVFVSCEHRLTKARGDLYDVVLRSVDAAPSEVLHVGDNPHADIAVASQRGVATLQVPNPRMLVHRRFERFRPDASLSFADSAVLGTCASSVAGLGPSAPVPDVLGGAVLAPAIVRWSDWILSTTSAGDQPVLFSSRDTGLVLRAVNARVDKVGGASNDHLYFHVSRRSLGIAAQAGGLTSTGRELILGGRRPLTARQLLAAAGLSDTRLISTYQRLHGDVDEQLPFGAARDRLWQVLLDAEEIVRARAQQELEAFGAYWERLGVKGQRAVYLVDVGWRGTVQRSLEHCLALLGESTRIDGLYFALLNPPMAKGTARGMVVDGDPAASWRFALEAGIPVIEGMLQDDIGSVLGYADGQPVLASTPARRDLIDPIQAAAEKAVMECSSYTGPFTDSCVLPLLRLVTQPRPEEAAFLGRFEHADSLGAADEFPILPEHARIRDFLRPGFRSTIRASEWRTGLVALAGSPAPVRLVASHGLELAKRAAHASRTVRGLRAERGPTPQRFGRPDPG